jgi:hypothetical protein
MPTSASVTSTDSTDTTVVPMTPIFEEVAPVEDSSLGAERVEVAVLHQSSFLSVTHDDPVILGTSVTPPASGSTP